MCNEWTGVFIRRDGLIGEYSVVHVPDILKIFGKLITSMNGACRKS